MSTPAVPERTIYVTQSALPLSFKLAWPFRMATSGADFHVLHAEITLENSGGLRALVSVNLSVTLREVLPSLEAKDTEGPIINALRKDVDRKQIEFVRSGKLVPLPFSSRHYDFKRNQWVFGKATDFFGAYWHDDDFGMVRYAPRDEKAGKHFYLSSDRFTYSPIIRTVGYNTSSSS